MYVIFGKSIKFSTISLTSIFRYEQVLRDYLFKKVGLFLSKTFDASKFACFDVAQVDHNNVPLLDLYMERIHEYFYYKLVSLASFFSLQKGHLIFCRLLLLVKTVPSMYTSLQGNRLQKVHQKQQV